MVFPIIAALALGSGSVASILPRATAPQAFCSSSDGKYKLSAFDAPVLGTGDNSAGLPTWAIQVDDSDAGHKQQITGFGAAVTDATVSVFNLLPAETRAELMGELMTLEGDGVGFGLMRHTIASSDLSADPAYSYDDNGGKPDPSFSSFNLGDRGNAMAAMLKTMRGLNPDLTILGSPWAPPGWMQLDGVLVGTTVNNNLNHNYVDQYAEYFVRYIQAYEAAGAPIDAITIQNEPLHSSAGFPTMYIFADESGKLINENVGPALKAAGLSTHVWAYDHNTGK